MKFLKVIWGHDHDHEKGRPDPDHLSADEVRLTITKYDRVLAELNEALAASRGKPDVRWQPDAP